MGEREGSSEYVIFTYLWLVLDTHITTFDRFYVCDFMCTFNSPFLPTNTNSARRKSIQGVKYWKWSRIEWKFNFLSFGKWTIKFYLFSHQINSVYCYDAFIWMKIYKNLIPLASFYNWIAFFNPLIAKAYKLSVFMCIISHFTLEVSSQSHAKHFFLAHTSPFTFEISRVESLPLSHELFSLEKIFALFFVGKSSKQLQFNLGQLINR